MTWVARARASVTAASARVSSAASCSSPTRWRSSAVRAVASSARSGGQGGGLFGRMRAGRRGGGGGVGDRLFGGMQRGRRRIARTLDAGALDGEQLCLGGADAAETVR